MGAVRHLASGRRIPLAQRTLVGRAPSCGLRVDHRLASKEHALISWSGTGWAIRDLDSTNGSYIGGVCMVAGSQRAIDRGARLAFGGADDEWLLEDAGPPGLFAIELTTREVALPTEGVLSLRAPGGEVALAAMSGARVMLDLDGEAQPLPDTGVVRVGTASWWVLAPAAQDDGTPLASSVAQLTGVSFHFSVPKNEEGVSLSLVFGGDSIELAPREHIYLLLLLARARIAERAKPVAERGWLHRDRLLEMLHWEESAIRVAIHRARAQVAAAGLPDPESLVESRRPFLRRFGSDRVSISTAD